jgi:hypothetical protein
VVASFRNIAFCCTLLRSADAHAALTYAAVPRRAANRLASYCRHGDLYQLADRLRLFDASCAPCYIAVKLLASLLQSVPLQARRASINLYCRLSVDATGLAGFDGRWHFCHFVILSASDKQEGVRASQTEFCHFVISSAPQAASAKPQQAEIATSPPRERRADSAR